MKLKNYIKYVSLVIAVAAIVASSAFAQAQVLTGNKMITTLVDNTKSIAVANCDYSLKNTTGTYPKDTIGFIVGTPVTYKCSDGITVEFLNVSFQVVRKTDFKTSTAYSLGYINAKAVKQSPIPVQNNNITSSAVSLVDQKLMIQPSCVYKTSNESGGISKGLIGAVLNPNVVFVCPDKTVLNLVYVRFVAGTGANRDTVEGYATKSSLKITDFDSTNKSNINVVTPTTNVDILYKPTCKTSKGYNAQIYANASANAVGNVIGTTYKIKCGNVFETFYNVGFPRDPNSAEAEYIEGFINAKNVKITPIGVTKVTQAAKPVTNYVNNLYKAPACTFAKKSANDLGFELAVTQPSINGKVVGELTLTCNGVKNTFYKVIFSYATLLEFHEGAIGYIKSTDL
jgi:hypothetical protein